jgi:5-methylthioadenosine/S-adenosylhomocysteine deaminase
MSKTLIRGGWVLTMGRANLTGADVLIDGDTIVEVGPSLRARDAEVIDAAEAIVMPGFVDSHRHAAESLFRHGAGETTTATPRRFGTDDAYAATLLGLLGALDAGITSVVDWCAIDGDVDTTASVLQAHRDAGVRSVLVHAAAEGEDWSAGLRRVAGARSGPFTTIAAGSADPHPGNLDAVAAEWALARKLGLRIHAHAGTLVNDAGVAVALAGRGLLAADITLVHCTHFSDADFDAVAAAGCGVALTPSSVMAAGSGAPPIQGLVDRGIRPGLGAESERFTPGDTFAQMRAVISVQHATVFERKLAGKAGLPKLLTTRDVIRYATVDGAAVAGLASGVLEPGRPADVIVLRTDRPNIHPINDPIGAVVWGMDTSNVDWVFVGGSARKRAGELVADTARVRGLAVAARDRMAVAGSVR